MGNKRQRDKLKKKAAEGDANARAALDRQSERNNERLRDYYRKDQPHPQSPPRQSHPQSPPRQPHPQSPPRQPHPQSPPQSRGLSSSHGVASPNRPAAVSQQQSGYYNPFWGTSADSNRYHDNNPHAGPAYSRQPTMPLQQQSHAPHVGPAKEVAEAVTSPMAANTIANKRVAAIVEEEPVDIDPTRMAQILGARSNPWSRVLRDKETHSITLDFEADDCFTGIHPPNKKSPKKILIMQSRYSNYNAFQSVQQLIRQSFALAIRKMHATPEISYTRLIIFHVNTWPSRNPLPHCPTHNAGRNWVPFIERIKTMPQGSAVDYMIRGWDGTTTVYSGLEHFVRTFGAGYSNIYNYQFDFVVFQHRESTRIPLQQLFGTYWNPPAIGTKQHVIETIMRVRIHPPFTHQQYMATLAWYHMFYRDPLRRQQNSTLALMYVWTEIDNAKRNGNQALWNRERHTFV
ncbi:hypothetical protein C7974DRAFT_442015 [Boeremia exigua]|uniref:uncharacterized protein n=1 Tax=Boeremia exigua TaxID=749465 RepID=UPI001E8D7297|nr:uncharacterized protein C7974DRAFT_442015 [Boeremia exigua]KAH6616350.1 hypothetical protein C7974DRAFT_442015 [Boeremia exigua]